MLRQLTLQDEHELFELRTNEAVNRFLNRQKPQSLQDVHRFIQLITDNIQKNETVYWTITLEHDPKLIGTIILFNFKPENDMAELGYELLPQYQGQGLMQEALTSVIGYGFTNMQLKTIEAGVHIHNNSSIKLLEKNHFIPQPLSQEEPNMVIYRLQKV
jgi:ribosomal-protein-alanine N-acetyltransferase